MTFLSARLHLRTSFVERLRVAQDELALPRNRVARAGRAIVVALAALSVSTIAVAWLERAPLLIADASPVYLVAVVMVATLFGTRAAILTAVAAFLLYDYLFTEPRFTIVVADPREWLELVLFLFVALVIGRLAAQETERAREATRRAREAEALAAISRTLATADTVGHAAPVIASRIAAEARMERVWVEVGSGIGATGGTSILADTNGAKPAPEAVTVTTLTRDAGADRPGRWIAIHGTRPGRRASVSPDIGLWTVRLEAAGLWLGSLWGARRRTLGEPSLQETRLLALAADQLALALRREQLAREATEAEITRQGEALKSALLDAVSHDLRTPLASIRATAGSLIDPAVRWSDGERRGAALAIDAEAERLSGLVQKVLDLGRIEGDALRPEMEAYDARELVEPAVARAQARHARRIEVVLDELPPVRADAVLFETVLTNLLENAITYGGDDAPIRVRGMQRDGMVDLTVEDGGSGVPEASLPRLFERFYRVRGSLKRPRPGLGIGLSIVKGFVEAMGGEISGFRSELGGLGIRIGLPVAPDPPA
jgi:two-component system sensor histidine kinase KdpD